MGTDYNWNHNCRGVVYPDRISFSYDRTWTFHGNRNGHPLSLTCWRKPNGYNYGYSFSSTRCRNSYDYNYCYSFPCCPKSYCYSNRYGDSFPCFGNSYNYRHSDTFSFSCSGNTYDYRYSYDDSFSCFGNTYNYDYGYGDSFSFSCSTDPHHYYYAFTHCDRNRNPNGRCIIVGNTYGHLDVYPDSFTYGSGVSDSFSNRSDNNNSFVHCSGDSDSDTDRVQYSWPPSFSNGNSVGDQHSFQQSPTCLRERRERRQYCFQQYWNHCRFRNWRCSPGCDSNYSRVLPHGQPSSSHCLASAIPSIAHNYEYSACLLPGRCGTRTHHDCTTSYIFCSPNE